MGLPTQLRSTVAMSAWHRSPVKVDVTSWPCVGKKPVSSGYYVGVQAISPEAFAEFSKGKSRERSSSKPNHTAESLTAGNVMIVSSSIWNGSIPWLENHHGLRFQCWRTLQGTSNLKLTKKMSCGSLHDAQNGCSNGCKDVRAISKKNFEDTVFIEFLFFGWTGCFSFSWISSPFPTHDVWLLFQVSSLFVAFRSWSHGFKALYNLGPAKTLENPVDHQG